MKSIFGKNTPLFRHFPRSFLAERQRSKINTKWSYKLTFEGLQNEPSKSILLLSIQDISEERRGKRDKTAENSRKKRSDRRENMKFVIPDLFYPYKEHKNFTFEKSILGKKRPFFGTFRGLFNRQDKGAKFRKEELYVRYLRASKWARARNFVMLLSCLSQMTTGSLL